MPRILIAGVDARDGHLEPNTVSISGSLTGGWTLSANFRDLDGSFSIPKLASVVVYDDDSPETTRFAGLVMRVKKTNPPHTSVFNLDIEARDYSILLSKRYCRGTLSYATGTSVYDILSHVVNTLLSGEGITLGEVDSPAPTLDGDLTFNYASVKEILEKLASATQCSYSVDFDKHLNFGTLSGSAAPFSITEASGGVDGEGDWKNLSLTDDDANYRNRQIERCATILKNVTSVTESTTSIAGQWQFGLNQIVSAILSVSVDGTPETVEGCTYAEWNAAVGSGVPPGASLWYYITDMGCAEVDRLAGALTAGKVVEVTYQPCKNIGGQATAPPAVVVNDTTEQTSRAAASGCSGIWEAVEEQSDISSAAALVAIGERQISEGIKTKTIQFETRRSGLMPGQWITVDLPSWGAELTDADFMIQSVTYKWIKASTDFWWTSVTAGHGFGFGTPVEQLVKLFKYPRTSTSVSVTTEGIPGVLPSSAPPDTSSWEWINLDGSGVTLDTSRGYPYLDYPARSGDHWVLLVKPVIGSVFTLEASIRALWSNNNFRSAGICLYDSVSGKFVFFGGNVQAVTYLRYNSVTSFSTQVGRFAEVLAANQEVRLRIEQTSTARIAKSSYDNGSVWVTHATLDESDWITPTHYGIALDPISSSFGMDLACLDWRES